MLVTHLITRLVIGGAQENTVATVLGLQEKPEFRTTLVSGPTRGSEGSLENEFQKHPGVLQVCPPLVRPVRPWSDLSALLQLTRAFQKTHPSIVHTHSSKAGIVGRWAAWFARVPVIIHTIHGPSFGPWQGSAANTIFRFVERQAGRITTHFISVAAAMTAQYREARIGHPSQYTRIFSGFNLRPFLEAKNDPLLRARFGISPDELVIGKIARLFDLKGHDDLFAIAPEFIRTFPNAKFLIIGGGPWEERFRTMARASGFENHFVFTGLVPPSQVPALTGIMDILVHLSLREGLPRALPQALAASKPVVAYDCDGAKEVCLEKKTGFLIPPRDLSLLKRQLEVLATQPELRAQFGKAGQNFVRENFAVEKMVEEIYRLYLVLLKKKGVSAGLAG
jgi:glycosyltransferase involved in cell wall biosynthesis